MALITTRTPDAANYHIVSGLHISLRLLEEFGRTLHWKVTDEIKELGDKTLSLAVRPKSKPVAHGEFIDIAKRARQVCSNAWGTMLQDTSLDVIAPIVNSLEKLAIKVEEEGESAFDADGQLLIPDVARRLMQMREDLAGTDPTNMSPIQKINHDRDLRSVGAAMDAVDTLDELRKSSNKEIRVSKLNVEFVSEPSLRSWLLSMEVQGGLPEDRSILMEALDGVEKYHHADASIKAQLTEAWSNAVPMLNEESLATAVNAVLGSAASTKLDSLEYSAVEVVKNAINATYDEGIHRRERHKAEAEAQKSGFELARDREIRELEPLLIDLNRSLTSLENGLGYGVARQTVNDIKMLVERVNAKVEVLNGENEGAEPGPSL